MLEHTIIFGKNGRYGLKPKKAIRLARSIHEILYSDGFFVEEQFSYFFDVARIQVKGKPPAYLNPEEIFSFGVRNALEILLLQEASLVSSSATKGSYKGKFGCGFRFSMKKKDIEARLLLSSFQKPSREIDPDFHLFFGVKARDSSYGQFINDRIINLGKAQDCSIEEVHYDGWGWTATIFCDNSNEGLIKKEPQLSLDNIWLLENFKPFFEALDDKGKEAVVDKVYDYTTNKDAIVKFLQENHPQIVIDVGRERCIREANK